LTGINPEKMALPTAYKIVGRIQIQQNLLSISHKRYLSDSFLMLQTPLCDEDNFLWSLENALLAYTLGQQLIRFLVFV